MSIFSFLGGVGKGILKGAATVGKVGVNIVGQQLGIGPSFQIGSGSDAAQVANPQSSMISQSDGSQQTYQKQKASEAEGYDYKKTNVHKFASGLADDISKTKITVDHTADLSDSKMPSWLMPVGLGAAGLMVVMMMNNNSNRR